MSSSNGLPLQGTVVCVTGYVGKDRAQVKKKAKLLGAKFTEYLDKSCTYLVCWKPEGAKYLKACTYSRTDIVTLAWLQECVKTNSRVSFDERNVGELYRFKKKEIRPPKQKKRKKKSTTTAATTATAKGGGAKKGGQGPKKVAKKGAKKNVLKRSYKTQSTANASVAVKRRHSPRRVAGGGGEGGEGGAGGDDDGGVAALTKKLLGGGNDDDDIDPTSPSGSDDKLMTEQLLALVKRKAGARTPSNSQTSREDVDLPDDYYTSISSRGGGAMMGTPGVSPKGNKGGAMVGNHGDDESQGVKWGSEDEGVVVTSDDEDE